MSLGVAGGLYQGALRDIIHAFKYEGRRSLADPLSRLMRVAAGPVLENCDAVVPVPLHPWRRIRRGFNQARDLAERLDRPIVDALWRVRATASQMTLDAAARHRNVSGAFVVSPLAPSIENQVVILIDDVRTTGSTLDQCAKVLLRARARTVYAVTVASAERTGAGRGGTSISTGRF